MDIISTFFDFFLINPLTNLFVFLSGATGNAGIGVVLLTLVIRAITYPLTKKQMHSTRMMGALGPRMQEIQKRYKDPKRRSEEQMKLYREAGINPLGCFSSMLLQMPILIALYRTFSLAVGQAPESLVAVSERLYPISYLHAHMPLNPNFLWLHLGQPDPLILPVLVALSTYTLQKMTMMPATDERTRAQNSMMNLMMPLLFAWITINLPSGLGLYYVLSNLIGGLMQYVYVGGGPLNWRALVGLSQDPVLPRALEVRQQQLTSVESISRPSDYEDGDSADGGDGKASKKSQTADGKSADRRRRYSSGRRRSRR